MSSIQGFVIAGTHSGCGKTSVSLGIMGALARRGLSVCPFKVGPDFIDPGHHTLAASLGGQEAPSHNLDGWMLPEAALLELFQRHATGDLAVVEGVMGLFDGFSPITDQGSTAQLAKLLGLPVLLVVDAASMARSAAALVSGFASFDPGLELAGVIFNRVGSENHAAILTEALAHSLPGVPVLGCLPRREDIAAPSRHLGLVTAGEEAGLDRYHRLADWVETHLDLDRLLESLPTLAITPPLDQPPVPVRTRIGVARDEAFCFYYPENLRLLEAQGAELVFFSPLRDKRLPEDLGGLYLGGGYPELHGFELGQNSSLRKEILRFSQAGRPIYAECGGFMYLLESLKGPHGRTLSMCGVFPAQAVMNDRFSSLGYREVTLIRQTPLGPVGTTARGHEFHYSSLSEPLEHETAYAVRDRRGPRPAEGYLAANTLGSYIHLHFGSNPALAEHFVTACAII